MIDSNSYHLSKLNKMNISKGYKIYYISRYRIKEVGSLKDILYYLGYQELMISYYNYIGKLENSK